MVNRPSSLSKRNSGFIPLGGGPGGDMADSGGGIPLSTVKSNASTGARKAGMPGASSSSDSTNNEKSGLHFRHAGRRRKAAGDDIGREDDQSINSGDEASLNFMGKLYARVIGFSVVTRYLVYIVPVAILLAVPVVVLALTGHGFNQPPFVGRGKLEDGTEVHGPTLFRLFLWIEVAWLTCWAAKLVAWLLPHFFMFFCGIVSVGTRKYATVLSNLTLTISLFLWALASWLTFSNWLRVESVVKWSETLERILGALFVSSAVLLGEKAIVQLIGVSYHQRSFANRIKESKREVHLLGLLYDASRTLFPMYCPEFEEEDLIINDSIEMILRGKKRGKAGANPIRLIGDVTRLGDKVTSVFGNIASEITGKQVFNPNSAHSIVIEALEKIKPTEALARRIWMSFAVEDRDSLIMDDIKEVLGPAYKDEAEEAFNIIDGDDNGDISLDEMVRKVTEIGKERKAIAEGMKDIGQALQVLDQVLLFVVLIIAVFIFLAFFRSGFLTTLSTAGTALLSLSFVFAATCQEFLGSCIFLFVKHPFDVGDRVEITSTGMFVERISLLYSVFTRVDTNQVVQIPNIVLNNLWVDNFSRSKAMVEFFEVDVSYDTTFEDIELLRAEMEQFVQAPENSRDFKPDFTIGVGGVGSLDKMTLKLSIKHKSNWHNGVVKATRRSKFMCALAMALKKVPIYGPGGGGEPLGGPTNPSYSVAVSDSDASMKRDEAARAKEALRMVPSQGAQTEEEMHETEKQAASGISAQPPIIEAMGGWDPRDDRAPGVQENVARGGEASLNELQKQPSQRGGRRKAGEVLHSPSLAPTTTNTSMAGGAHSPRLETFDEEARTGMPSSFYATNRARSASTASHQPAGHNNMLHPLRSSPSTRGRRHPSNQSHGTLDPHAP
ncbi:Mechanosensitive ion channel protein Msy1 [Paramyrothecium foliicola]|nr:Mechanosensitive ion channel protein Msy1 [Paramyrothecium foliicola]